MRILEGGQRPARLAALCATGVLIFALAAALPAPGAASAPPGERGQEEVQEEEEEEEEEEVQEEDRDGAGARDDASDADLEPVEG